MSDPITADPFTWDRTLPAASGGKGIALKLTASGYTGSWPSYHAGVGAGEIWLHTRADVGFSALVGLMIATAHNRGGWASLAAPTPSPSYPAGYGSYPTDAPLILAGSFSATLAGQIDDLLDSYPATGSLHSGGQQDNTFWTLATTGPKVYCGTTGGAPVFADLSAGNLDPNWRCPALIAQMHWPPRSATATDGPLTELRALFALRTTVTVTQLSSGNASALHDAFVDAASASGAYGTGDAQTFARSYFSRWCKGIPGVGQAA